MFVFSEQKAWQKEDAVQQVLVFANQTMQENFVSVMRERECEVILCKGTQVDIDNISDSGAGAIYKLRAVKRSDGRWASVIRCGVNGDLLWEMNTVYTISAEAIAVAKAELLKMITESFEPVASKPVNKDQSEKYFTLYWINGKRNVIKGTDIADAFSRVGYGAGALPALDWYDEGVTDTHRWNNETKAWIKRHPVVVQLNDVAIFSKGNETQLIGLNIVFGLGCH